MRINPHWPSMVGRARADRGLLALTGLVVMLATLLTAAIAPLTETTSDRAIAAAVRDAGSRGDVVATTFDDGGWGPQDRDPKAAANLLRKAKNAERKMPALLSTVLKPGITSMTTPPLHLLDAGPGRFMRLAFVNGPGAAPASTFVSGGPPGPGTATQGQEGDTGVDPLPVEVALSQEAASALGLGSGDRVTAEDEQHRQVIILVSGVFTADNPKDRVWGAVPELLHPLIGKSHGLTSTSGAAFVSAESLPDLLLAVPSDDLTTRFVFTPQPSRVRWGESEELKRAVVSLTSSPRRASSGASWDSLLDRVLADGRAQVKAAQGQASVLIVGLLGGALLLLVLTADLLVRRRAGSLAMLRERGGSLAGISIELFIEAATVAAFSAAVGTVVVRILAGDVGWRWSVPVLVVASLASPILGAVASARAADTRRVPANRSARRTAARARGVRRLLIEGTVVVAAVLSFVALRERGVVGDGDLTAASAPLWWALAGGLVIARLLPTAARLVLSRARRASSAVPLVAAARASGSAVRRLPFLVVAVALAQLTLSVAMAATEQHGQAEGALLSVGGDARLQTAPDRSVSVLADSVARAHGVRAAVAARIADGVSASSGARAANVRLVVVDAAAYQRLRAASPLPDAPQLALLRPRAGGGVRALLRGGDPGLREGLNVRWQDTLVPLNVVGTAPAVDDSSDPVVIVDAEIFGATGAVVDPGTIWAVGPGAATALRAGAGSTATVDVLPDVLKDRRSAPLASGLVHLAMASATLLMLFALLGVALAAAAEAPSRAESLGRLRSLGLVQADVRRVLRGELAAPVLVSSIVGLVLGIGASIAMFGALSLELVTGQSTPPGLVVPWWTALTVVVLVCAVLMIAAAEAARLGRAPLALLLRGGDRR